MRRIIAPIVILLTLGCGLAFAQIINKGVQLSQDPSGPIGFDSLLNTYFSNKVLVTRLNPPVLTTCGTAPSVLGNDTVGKLTTGSAATTCTMTFVNAYTVAPACVVSAQGTATQPTFTTSTTALTMSVDIASTVYNYICMSQG